MNILTLTGTWEWAWTIEYWIHIAFTLGCVLLAIAALLKCLPRNAELFWARNKRTKGFWLGMTGGAVALALFGMLGGPFSMLFPVAAACMAAVYLTDVDPEVSQ